MTNARPNHLAGTAGIEAGIGGRRPTRPRIANAITRRTSSRKTLVNAGPRSRIGTTVAGTYAKRYRNQMTTADGRSSRTGSHTAGRAASTVTTRKAAWSTPTSIKPL